MNPKLVTAKELAVIIGVHVKTIIKWARNGVIPCIKITKRCMRFDLEKCLAVLNKRTVYAG